MRLDRFRSSIRTLLLVGVQACVLVSCAGCVKFGSAYHLSPLPAPAPDQFSDSSKDVHRNEPSPAVYRQNPKIIEGYPPSVLTLEFSEWGRLIDCSRQRRRESGREIEVNCQVARALEYLKQAKKELDERNKQIRETNEQLKRDSKPPKAEDSLAVVTFIHGWHHNASWSSENFRNFQRAIDCLNWGADDYYNVLYPSPVTGSQPMVCEHIQRSNIRYIGVYVGWRGESLKVPGSPFRFMQFINFPFRRLGAERMGNSDDLFAVLTKLTAKAREGSDRATTVVAGHSFGGLILGRLAANHLTGPCTPVASGSRNLSFGSCHKEIADLMVLINPADNAIRSAGLIADWHHNGMVAPPPATQRSEPPTLPAPIVVSIFTPTDTATRIIQPAALWTLSLPADQIYPRAGKITSEMKAPPSTVDSVPWFYPIFRSTPPNGVKYLRNLCWLDQPRGLTTDDACEAVKKKITEIKQDAYEKVIPEAKGHGEIIGCLDGKRFADEPCVTYNPDDPFHHGAWELLTSICWLKSENPERLKDWWPWDFPNAVSCNENGRRRDQRRKLAEEFQARLGNYLAVPNLLADSNQLPASNVSDGSKYGNALFDLYLRTVPDTTSDGVESWRTAWNTTPFWMLNVPRETILSHSGIWNAEVFALISDLAGVASRSTQGTAATLDAQTATDAPPSGH